jgi:CHAT domain-containing protein
MAGRSVKAKASVDKALIAEADALQDRLDVLSRVVSRAEGSEAKALKEEYRQRVARRKDVLEAIRNQSLAYAAATSVATIPVRRVAERLPERTALVSYFLEPKRTLVWVVTRRGVSALRVDVGRESLNDLVGDYREAIASQQTELFRTLGTKLGRILVDPLVGSLQGIDELYVVPSLSLQYLPMAVLPWQGDRLVVDALAVCSLPNASALFYGRGPDRPGFGTIFAVGNPALDDKTKALAFAEAEVRSIGAAFKRRTILCGTDATETCVKAADMTGTDVMHLAVHGEYSARSPLESALLLVRDGRNDGRLAAFEIFAMDIPVPLVVLSACQSGTGTTSGGDEVQSLNRAFLYAGAGQVMGTLWNVNDQSTAALMQLFYESMATQGPAQALRSAQLKLRQKCPAAYHWAPFYLSGGSLP